MHGIESTRQPYGFGSFVSKAFKKVARPIKKVLKSPIGKMALLGGLGAYGASQGMFGPGAKTFMTGPGKWGKIMSFLGGTEGTQAAGAGAGLPFLGEKGFIASKPNILMRGLSWAKANPLKTAGIVGLGAGTASALAADKGEEEIDETISGKGHEDYLKMRKLWDWGGEEPMFSAAEGGRVHAQQGLLATPQHAQMMEGQGQQLTGADPRMTEQITEEAGTTGQGTQQTADAELIQIIKMLASMGIPMEQLRGRSKQELVELMISVSGKGGQEQEIVEQAAEGGRIGLRGGGDDSIFIDESMEVLRGGQDGDVEVQENTEMASDPTMESEWWDGYQNYLGNGGTLDFEDWKMEVLQGDHRPGEGRIEGDIREQAMANQGGLMRTGYAMGTEHPVIPSKDGSQLDMRETGGYQPHGAQEKKDDVRALLAQGEFVMTSDAVKGMGGGDREAGAKKMYNLMHNMEAMA